MRKALLATAFIAVAGAAAAGPLDWLVGRDAPPTVSEMQAALKSLAPLSAGGRFDVSIYIWADGTVNVSMKLKEGVEIRGRGTTLNEALASLQRSARGARVTSESLEKALAPLVPSQ